MRFVFGILAALFMTAAATAQAPHDTFQTSATFAMSAGKLLRMEHEGSANEAQILTKLTAPILQYDRNGDGLDRDDPPVAQFYEIDDFLDAISVIDPTYQDRLTLEGASALAPLLVLRLDTDQNGVVSQYEIFDLMAAHQIPPEGTCEVPVVPGEAEVLLLEAGEGERLASVNLGDVSEDTHYAEIFVEDGDKPLYVLLSVYGSTVWSFQGNTARISQVAITAHAPQGVAGIDPTKVAFIGRGCLGPPSGSHDGLTAQFNAQRLVGEGVKVAGEVELYAISIPSMQTLSRDTGVRPTAVVAIDPTTVVAEAEVSTSEVLPEWAGIEQLLASGQLEQVEVGTYRIVKPIPHYPAGLYGALSVRFILAPGVPEPAGDVGHSCFLTNEEGARPSHGRLCSTSDAPP
jgi:hypothetical protein